MELLQSSNILLALMMCVGVIAFIIGMWFETKDKLYEIHASLSEYYRDKFVLELQFPEDQNRVFLMYGIAVLLLFLLFLMLSPILAIIVLVGAYFFPNQYFNYQKIQRLKKIDSVLPNVLQQLAANTKNTGSITMALREVSQTAPKPMDYELALIGRQEQELKSFTKALNNTRERLDSRWFDIVSAVMITADEKGGRASEALDNLSKVFIQLIRMQTKIDTATSQGRMSMKLMLAMPFVVIGIVYAVDPDLMKLASETKAGKITLGIAAFFYFLSLSLAIWLSKVEI